MIIRVPGTQRWWALPEHKGMLVTNMASLYLWLEGETQVITTCRSLWSCLRHIVREMAMHYKTTVFIKPTISVYSVLLESGSVLLSVPVGRVASTASSWGAGLRGQKKHSWFLEKCFFKPLSVVCKLIRVIMIFCGLLFFFRHKTILWWSNQWLHSWSTA